MLVVDRIENGLAVCEQPDRTMTPIPLSQLPADVKEGDCLVPGATGYRVDAEETRRRREATRALFQKLKRKEL